MASSDLKPFEQHADDKKTPAWLVAAAKAHENWPAGQEMTAEAFDAATQKVATLPIGYGVAAPK